MRFFSSIGWLFRPRNNVVPIFSQQAAYLCEAADLLVRMLDSTDMTEWRRYERDIKRLEEQGDALLTEFHRLLQGRLIGTAGKLELQSIGMLLDDCIDTVEDSARSLMLYRPNKIDEPLKELSQLIRSGAYALREVLPKLSDFRTHREQLVLACDRVTEVEHAADETYEEYVGYIFAEEEDLRELTKYKNIAEVLEGATDNEKRVSDAVRKLLIR